MKKVISIALFAPFVLSSLVSVSAQQGANPQKPKEEPKSPNAETTSSLTANSALQSATGSPARAESSGEPMLDPSLEAQKHYNSGMALSETGRFEEAVAAFKQSLKLKPEDPQTNFSLGMTYSKSKSYKEAFDYFKRAVRYKPDWPEAHFRLGIMSYVLGKKTQSIDEYKKLLELNSPLANLLYRIVNEENASSGQAENVKAVEPNGALTPNIGTPVSQPSAPASDAVNPLTAADSSTRTPVTDRQLTEIYRVGVGDVLDVRFLNSPNNRSTLFTVIGGGLIDLPIAGGPISVVGLTTDEIQTRISAELKRRAVEENAKVSVGVRQYGSHSVMVTGLVVNPGTRFLRREAVPLYVVLAESQLRNDAGRVAIMRAGAPGQSFDLSSSLTLNVTVQSGDVITVTSRPQEFYYIAGRVNYPGQKAFQPGITLLQAILAAGGTSRKENRVEISREGTDGRLITTRFSIREIKSGTVEDPKLQPGDRIEVEP